MSSAGHLPTEHPFAAFLVATSSALIKSIATSTPVAVSSVPIATWQDLLRQRVSGSAPRIFTSFLHIDFHFLGQKLI